MLPLSRSRDASTRASSQHLTAAPTLLPSVIFQELVFGRDLGSGSFSTVRYCKHVRRDRPATAWPEYAASLPLAHPPSTTHVTLDHLLLPTGTPPRCSRRS